jgi:hypothetical protein
MTPIDLSTSPFARLSAHLLDLLHELRGQYLPLIIVGGFGLFLRREYIEQAGVQTLYEIVPEPRATDDFDIVLKLKLLADRMRMQTLRAALEALKYEVVEKAEEYQFYIPGTASGSHRNVKIDLLARDPEEGDPRLYRSGFRLKPSNRNSPLHAFKTPEAIAVEDGLQEVVIEGNRTTGDRYRGPVFLPAAYALYLMKLFAFRDEEKKANELDARKHAMDIYSLSALLTIDEYDALPAFRERYSSHSVVVEASAIVQEYFGHRAAVGAVRLQEHPNFPARNQLPDFLDLLADIFRIDEIAT